MNIVNGTAVWRRRMCCLCIVVAEEGLVHSQSEDELALGVTPYKQALQEKQQMGSKPKRVVLDSKKSKTKTKKSSNRTKDKKKFPTSTLSTDKTPCLYCEEPYCNSEEGFVQCSSCSLWAHYSCAGYDPRVGGSFVCELCQ